MVWSFGPPSVPGPWRLTRPLDDMGIGRRLGRSKCVWLADGADVSAPSTQREMLGICGGPAGIRLVPADGTPRGVRLEWRRGPHGIGPRHDVRLT